VRPVCINASRWDCTLEPIDGDDNRFAVRLGLRLVKGLGKAEAARLVSCREEDPLVSVDDLWRRAGIPAAALVELAEADAFRPSLGLARREALWAIKALRDEPLPLFAAAANREAGVVPEQSEPEVYLKPMEAGREVVEDYGHVGLSLRRHPVSFLRSDLARQRFVTCAEAVALRDGRWVNVAGLVLVRQRPGSAKGVMFITLEDETSVANLVVWSKVFEKYRRTVLGSGMLGVKGRVQREGEVVHIVARELIDLSSELASVGSRVGEFPLPHGRGDGFHHGSPAPDPRGIARPRDMADPYGHIDEIKVKTRDFR
ncbi:MAG: error-prone DNA polymerase, partial [Rhizobiaceae bacterium]|nr:error-prone DNA polymerase [Rhizobiaceae bacterium]